ncbi:hypothetical protein V8C44DRAFT_322824 [Trichoderma aethiopicum]
MSEVGKSQDHLARWARVDVFDAARAWPFGSHVWSFCSLSGSRGKEDPPVSRSTSASFELPRL